MNVVVFHSDSICIVLMTNGASLVAQSVKNLPAVPEPGVQSLGRDNPPEKEGNVLQYSCLENPMDRGAWQVTVHGVARVGHDLALNHHQWLMVLRIFSCYYLTFGIIQI